MLVFQGYRDILKPYKYELKMFFVHNSATSKPFMSESLIEKDAIFGFRIFYRNDNQAYFWCAKNFMREVYIKPLPNPCPKPNPLLQFLKPLQVLSDSGDYRSQKLIVLVVESLEMQSSVSDTALLFFELVSSD